MGSPAGGRAVLAAVLTAAAVVVAPWAARAQDSTESNGAGALLPVLQAQLIPETSEIDLDGRLEEAVWQQAAAVAGAYATTPGASEQASSRKRMRAAGQQQGASLQPDELHPGPLEQQQEQGQGQGQAEPPADLAMITDRRHAEQAEQAMH